MTKKSFLHLLTKEISGNISDNEQKLLNESRKENQTFDQVYTEMHRFMQSENSQPPVDVEAKLDEVWQRIQTQTQPTLVTRKRIVPLWSRVAASVAIILGLGVLAYHYLPTQQNLYTQTLQAGNENLYAVLDDGTQVWLSKHSQLTYNDNFGEKRRAIQLTGEAFFDVAHRPEVPLTVSANKVDVTVKGTAFNVNAANLREVAVTLVRGLVAVKDNDKPMKEILLHPNEKIIVPKQASGDNYTIVNLTPQANDSIPLPETRWMNDMLVFQKQKFQDLAKLMESRYRVFIQFANPQIGAQRFTGSIQNETLPQMLDALKQSYPFTYEINNNVVTIR